MENNEKDEKNELEEEEIKSDSKNSMFSIVVILIIILFLVIAYLAYRGEWINKGKNVKEYDSASLNDLELDDPSQITTEIDENFDANEEAQKLEEKKVSFESGKNNVVITKSVIQNKNEKRNLLLEFTNNNAFDLNTAKLHIVFFDGNEEIVGIKQAFATYIKANNTYYAKINDIPQNYETYKLFIDTDSYDQNIKKYDDQIEYSYEYNDENGIVEVSVKNNSGTRLEEVEFAVIYYNQDKTINDIDFVDFFDLKKNKSDKDNSYKYDLDENGNKVSFTADQIEVKLLTAYNIEY